MDKALIGMEQGDETDVTVKYPKSYADKELAGQTKNYHVKVRNIYCNVAPEVNDEFIQSIFANAPALPEGEEYPKTLEEYNTFAKTKCKNNLTSNLMICSKTNL